VVVVLDGGMPAEPVVDVLVLVVGLVGHGAILGAGARGGRGQQRRPRAAPESRSLSARATRTGAHP
jgi:hypothetical protein